MFGVHTNSFCTDFPCLPAVASQTRAKSGPTAAWLVRRRFDKARLTVDRDGAANERGRAGAGRQGDEEVRFRACLC